MNIYFQFLTQNQSVDAVCLMVLSTAIIDGKDFNGRVHSHAQAVTSRASFSKLTALCAKMTKKRFNQLDIIFDTEGLRFGRDGVPLKSLKGVFTPSPTCALWLPTNEWRIDANRPSRNKYMTARSHENAIAFHSVSREPSVFSLFLEITRKMPEEGLLDECAERLDKITAQAVNKLQFFGCCDIVLPVYIPRLRKSVVMPQRFEIMMNAKPQSYAELGERVEALHPLMFGSEALCRGIVENVGKGAHLKTSSAVKDFAVVRLPQTAVGAG